ncbi:MAG: 2-hydroxyacid dehydrogenase [Clostridia bacterium]|nr:2-hydroxyacid dehydrogenase [Clostridia bacterium]
MKVAFFDSKNYDVESFQKFKTSGLDFKFFETKLSLDTVELARGYNAVCVFVNDVVNKEVIDKLISFNVQLIALRCAGYNNVDIKAAQGKIKVVRVPAYSPNAVAEHTMALLLTSVRRIHKAYIRIKDFNFSLSGLTGFDLCGKTIGVIGTGKIGKEFIDICNGFKMNVLAYDIAQNKDVKAKYTDLNTLFEKSDIISLHCPLTPQTQYIINKKSIEKMKKGVVIINTSRGALINADDLLEGIKSRKIGAACLDVYEEEAGVFFNDFSGHIIDDDTLARLITMPNVILTSHQAFLTTEALNNIAETTINNILDIEKNNSSKNEVII